MKCLTGGAKTQSVALFFACSALIWGESAERIYAWQNVLNRADSATLLLLAESII